MQKLKMMSGEASGKTPSDFCDVRRQLMAEFQRTRSILDDMLGFLKARGASSTRGGVPDPASAEIGFR